ncbi:hypothetical protein JCM8547_003083 [Rhodosporidiobolus lusitaniae]
MDVDATSTASSGHGPRPNPALAVFDLSLLFTLVSSDGLSFTVDPLKLAGTSSVFADMLSSGVGERKVILTETKEDIEGYLNILEMGKLPTSKQAWYALWKMVDKYDNSMLKV